MGKRLMCTMHHIDIQYTYRLLVNTVDGVYAVCYRLMSWSMTSYISLTLEKALKSKWFLTFIHVLMRGTFMNVRTDVANVNQQMHTRARRCNQQQLCYCEGVSQLAHTKTQPGCVC